MKAFLANEDCRANNTCNNYLALHLDMINASKIGSITEKLCEDYKETLIDC
jgi:hypothetical protein